MRLGPTALGTGVLIALVVPTLVPAAAQAAPAVHASATLSCSAAVSNARPVQHSTVVVSVGHVAAGATVTTVAHYKTTKKSHSATASAKGTATLPYKIDGATHGFKVNIDVTATKGAARWSCRTSFTTR